MKIYHTKTQEDYDALMSELGYEGESKWFLNKSDTHVVKYTENIVHTNSWGVLMFHPSEEVIEYIAQKNNYKEGEYHCLPKEEIAKRINDAVNSPKHYTQGEYEVIDILKDKLTKEEFEGFLKGNILKYTFRENIKNGTEDMKKAA